jgi:hypothetical protein
MTMPEIRIRPDEEATVRPRNDVAQAVPDFSHLFPRKARDVHSLAPEQESDRLAGVDRVVAIIPARGGSKGLARKNVRLLGGKPLVAYSIEAALAATSIKRVIVSTEDPEIAAIAGSYGQDIVLNRPKRLASDRSSLDAVLRHALTRLTREGFAAEHVVVLLPTHPFRTPSLIDFLTGRLLAGFNPVLTVRAISCSPWSHGLGRDGFLRPLTDQGGRRDFVRSYGLYSGFSPSLPTNLYCHPISHPAELVDIDYASDFLLAESIVANALFNFGTVAPC